MEDIAAIIKIIMGGGLQGVIALLMALVAYLVWDRRNSQKINAETLKQLSETLSEKFEHDKAQLIKIIDQYHQGQLTIAQAMNELKLLLSNINSRI
jgi:uncharacterized protein YbgA (DUF1722 family)